MHEKLKKSIKLLNDKRKHKGKGSVSTDTEKAIRRSRVITALKAKTKQLHMARLNQLLAANERKRFEISADGNCFFAAIAESTNDSDLKDLDGFRNAVCDYMLQHKGIYLPFLSKEIKNKNNSFEEEIAILQRNGHWNANLADGLPLVTDILKLSYDTHH